jgi:hypothetical protein
LSSQKRSMRKPEGVPEGKWGLYGAEPTRPLYPTVAGLSGRMYRSKPTYSFAHQIPETANLAWTEPCPRHRQVARVSVRYLARAGLRDANLIRASFIA